MARKAAWEELADADLGPYAKSRGTRWGRVLVGLLLVAGATFVAAYYLPLYRAHQKLADEYRELGQRAQTLSDSVSKAQLDLRATTAQRDQLQAEHDQRESAKKLEDDRRERLRAALSTKLDKISKKGSATVVASGGSLVVALDGALLFAPQKLELTAPGRALLCEVVKVGEAKSVRVRDSLAEGATLPAALAKSFPNVWGFSAARAAVVAQALQEACAVAPSQLSATGSGSSDPLAAQLTTLKAPVDRLELELELEAH